MATAYDLNLPCLNPNCHSHGVPHPNCRCYGFSEGGEVGHYCSEARPHKPECEYFAAGGDVLPSFDEMKSQATGQKEKLPSFDEMKAAAKPEKSSLPSFDEMKVQSEKAEAPADTMEQLKAGVEGISQGLVGDLAKVVQVKTGISTIEDIERREKEYPLTHDVSKGAAFAGSLFAGPAKAITASVGSKLLGNVLAASAYSLSDNTAKAFLGQPGGDVNSVVSGTILRGGLEGLMNTMVGGLFSTAPRIAKGIFNEKTVKMAENAMIDLAEKPISKALVSAGSVVGAKNIGSTGILGDVAEYKVIKEAVKPMIEKIIGKPLTKANQYVGDAILNALAKTDFMGIPAMIRWAERASGGIHLVTEPIEALFKSGAHTYLDKAQEGLQEEIHEWMEQGGIDGELERSQQQEPDGFASGGQVANPNRSFENLYPAENIMLNQARSRVSGYLNSLRPSKTPQKLPFDLAPQQKQKQKAYNKALRLAASPISILEDMNKGTLTPEDMGHFKSMWPEVHDFLSSKMTERILKAQLNGEKPPYSKRQAMSLFLGADLDSTFTAQSIGVVQGMYAAKKQQRSQGVQGSKKALAKSSNQYQTDEQAREKRMQNQKA